MLSVRINEEEVKELCRQQIETFIREFEAELFLLDTNELKRRTCMSWETIQNTFFYDPRFPKFKIGGKWYYPYKETRLFLEQWLKEQTA